MSLSLQVMIGPETQIHYHTGVFTLGRSAGITAGLITSIALLSLAALSSVNQSPAALYAMLGSGGSLLLLTGGGAVYLYVQHKKKRAQLDKFVENQAEQTKWSNAKNRLTNTKYWGLFVPFSQLKSQSWMDVSKQTNSEKFDAIFERFYTKYDLHLYAPGNHSAFEKKQIHLKKHFREL